MQIASVWSSIYRPLQYFVSYLCFFYYPNDSAEYNGVVYYINWRKDSNYSKYSNYHLLFFTDISVFVNSCIHTNGKSGVQSIYACVTD